MASLPRDELVRRQEAVEAALAAQSGMLKEIRDRLVAVEKDTAFTRGQLAAWQAQPVSHIVRQPRWRQRATTAGLVAALVAIAEAVRELLRPGA